MSEEWHPGPHHGDEPAIRVLAEPQASNVYGDIFGGWIISQADLAGAIRALERAQGRITTVAVNHFRFFKPILAGDLVSFYARVLKVGNTSITIAVEAFAQRPPHMEQWLKVTEGVLTYVAVDENGKPRPIPKA